ncbi:hypothetical protein C1645_763447 [Glomus cerebriforme]|uniref:HMG box domain-containing protein n=1 Tax=Glomus cerebriforme TaxID=658196 RepID=A0A397T3W5_9GLOM|nr:hypothetical protein C1645_763447 [Glomus cerebriforme]
MANQGIYVFNVNQDSPPLPTSPLPSFFDTNNPTINFDLENDMKVFSAAQHELTIELDTLIKSPDTTRRAKKLKKANKIKRPRPQNAWILYRKDTNARLRESRKDFVKLKSCERSKIISKMWKEENVIVKNKFYVIAKWAEHELNKDYEYLEYLSRSSGERRISSPFDSNLSNLSSPSSNEWFEFNCSNTVSTNNTFIFPDLNSIESNDMIEYGFNQPTITNFAFDSTSVDIPINLTAEETALAPNSDVYLTVDCDVNYINSLDEILY